MAEVGGASGPFGSMVEFMKLRAQRLDWNQFREHVPAFPGDAHLSRTRLAPADLGGRYRPSRFVTGLCVPDCAHVVNETGGGPATAWFFDLTSRSWAAAEFSADEQDATVYRSGPRRLWDEVERALTWWTEQGRPDLARFGLTVHPDGTIHRWLDHPANELRFD